MERLLVGSLSLQGTHPHDHRSCFLSGPCPQDSCPNAACSGKLMFQPCAPCPLTCDGICSQVACPEEQLATA